MVSALGEDKRRYEILFRLGMDGGEQARALFRQTFPFFLLPFALPMIMGIPIAAVAGHVLRLLYYTATFLIARRAVVRE